MFSHYTRLSLGMLVSGEVVHIKAGVRNCGYIDFQSNTILTHPKN